MALKYGFFNSVGGDRKYNADDISNYFLKLISNGVFATPSSTMQVQANSGMTVQVTAGWGFINCKWVNVDAPYLLTLDASDTALDRIDRVVLRLNASNSVRNIEIAVKKGSYASTPTPPTLTRVSGGIWELSLAKISVAHGATSISQANITDERADTSVCGYVTGLIDQIDTTNLFAQFTAAFDAWFEDIKHEVASMTILSEIKRTYTTTTANESTIAIGISAYNSTLDILHVYVNGIKLIPAVDYTSDSNYIYLTNALDVIGTRVQIIVLQSIDTTGAASVVDIVQAQADQIDGLLDSMGGLKLRKLTRAAYDAITTKSDTTVYYVVNTDQTVQQYLGSVEIGGGYNETQTENYFDSVEEVTQ